MSPMLIPGDQLLIKLTAKNCDSFKSGQIVLYRDSKEWVAHRIIDMEADQLLVKGDVGLCRENVSTSRVIGVVAGRRLSNGIVEYWPDCLHAMARNLALASREISQQEHRFLRWPFYAGMRVMQSLAGCQRFLESTFNLR